MACTLSDIPASLPLGSPFPRPDWAAVSAWLSANVPEASHGRAWNDFAHEWLTGIAAAFGRGQRLARSPDFQLLSSFAPDEAAGLLAFCESARAQIRRTLGDVALGDILGPFAILVLDDDEGYYDYVSMFYPDEGEWGTSAGTYINEGYGHIVTTAEPRWHLRATLAHELVHAHLFHRGLPVWVEEGLAQMFEERLAGGAGFSVDHEIVARHRAYWSDRGLTRFWSAEAFGAPDEGQELAYHLAQVLVRTLLADRRDAFLAFLRAASAEDHGEAAARSTLGMTLNECAAGFLGTARA